MARKRVSKKVDVSNKINEVSKEIVDSAVAIGTAAQAMKAILDMFKPTRTGKPKGGKKTTQAKAKVRTGGKK